MASYIRRAHVLLLLISAACAGRSQEAHPDPARSATVEVTNQGFSDMVIYAVDGAQRVRLGMATGHSTRTFTIPRYLVGGARPLRFLADPVGGNRTPISEEMNVQPGDMVTLTIPPR